MDLQANARGRTLAPGRLALVVARWQRHACPLAGPEASAQCAHVDPETGESHSACSRQCDTLAGVPSPYSNQRACRPGTLPVEALCSNSVEQTGRAEPCAGGDLREAQASGISNTVQHNRDGNVGINLKQEQPSMHCCICICRCKKKSIRVVAVGLVSLLLPTGPALRLASGLTLTCWAVSSVACWAVSSVAYVGQSALWPALVCEFIFCLASSDGESRVRGLVLVDHREAWLTTGYEVRAFNG